ncbi:MAG: hypothetical protein IJJ98_12725 [Prevotella sp.]|nr:hypothetical protein [Prevotella sp.]MBR0527535.1 hypothetical protein [Prevotella sp.]
MERVQKLLMIDFWCAIALVALVVILGEFNVLPFEKFAGGDKAEFYLLTVMELLTIAMIPLALRLFKFKKIKTQLKEQRENALSKWGLIRMDMLCLPMFINAVLYYIYQHAAFGYLAIILFLCLFFVYPSKARCQAEVEADS